MKGMSKLKPSLLKSSGFLLASFLLLPACTNSAETSTKTQVSSNPPSLTPIAVSVSATPTARPEPSMAPGQTPSPSPEPVIQATSTPSPTPAIELSPSPTAVPKPQASPSPVPNQLSTSDQILGEAFKNKTGKLQVQGSGNVFRLLADDHDGSRHQRFILKLASGQTLLIAHNIDIAPKINALKIGDIVAFFGEYAWNDQGGVVHWTHKDPSLAHQAGWLKHQGRTYE